MISLYTEESIGKAETWKPRCSFTKHHSMYVSYWFYTAFDYYILVIFECKKKIILIDVIFKEVEGRFSSLHCIQIAAVTLNHD